MGRPFPFSYAQDASGRGWGSGWPKCGGASGNVVTVLAGNSGAKFAVHKRISRLADILVDECARRGYDFHASQCGAYNCRPIGGTHTPSNHSWGLAMDINWSLNPMTSRLVTNIPSWMVQLFEEYGFAWGGSYTDKKDAMHFEFMGTPAQADQQIDRAVHGLNNVAPVGNNDPSLLQKGMNSPAVGRWQDYLNKMYAKFHPALEVDNDFGNATVTRTKEVQHFLGIGVDGQVGPATRKATGFKG